MNIKLYSLTLDCQDPHALAEFYAALLDWDIAYADENFAVIGARGVNQGEYPGITFQKNPDYQPPVWPSAPDAQQQMEHMDFAVDDLEASVQHAVLCGARIAESQFADGWRVMFDPAGHPFCLCMQKHVYDSPHFALK